MNLKKLYLERLRWEKPVHIKELRIYRIRKRNGRLAYPPRWKVEFRPTPPPGALTWEIEGDEFILTSHHHDLSLGYIKLVEGLGGMRRKLSALIRRRTRKKKKR